MSPGKVRAKGGVIDTLASLVDTLRWAFLPLAMSALLAVGAHAAADVLDDRFLGLADRVDAIFDALVGRWELTRGLVDLVDLEERTWFARALALGFELWADLVLALPLLGYDEKTDELARVKELVRRAVRAPTLLRLTRAPLALALGLAGTLTVGRLLQGQGFVATRGLFGSYAAGTLARGLSLFAVLLVLSSITWRLFVRTLEHADQKSEPRTPRNLFRGAVASVFLFPLAVAGVARASSILGLWR